MYPSFTCREGEATRLAYLALQQRTERRTPDERPYLKPLLYLPYFYSSSIFFNSMGFIYFIT